MSEETTVILVKDSNKRAVAKTVTWKIVGGGAGWLIAYALTGDLAVSTLISFSKSFVNIFLYFLHERGWNLVKWGRIPG